jgi:hypothetical protein
VTDAELVAAITGWQDRIKLNAAHRYQWLDDAGKWSYVPGTTTVCKQLGGQGLLDWAARMGAETGDAQAHNKFRDEAGNAGTRIHKLIERECLILMGQPVGPMPETTEEELMALARWQRWRQDAEFRPLMVEFRVFHRTLNYAGTADVLGYVRPLIQGRRGDLVRVVGDWKGGKLRQDAHMQSVAYRAAVESMTGVDLGGYIVRVPRDGDCVVERPATTHVELTRLAFEGLLHAYHWQKAIEKEMKGAA